MQKHDLMGNTILVSHHSYSRYHTIQINLAKCVVNLCTINVSKLLAQVLVHSSVILVNI